jgi:hypothetical protein
VCDEVQLSRIKKISKEGGTSDDNINIINEAKEFTFYSGTVRKKMSDMVLIDEYRKRRWSSECVREENRVSWCTIRRKTKHLIIIQKIEYCD